MDLAEHLVEECIGVLEELLPSAELHLLHFGDFEVGLKSKLADTSSEEEAALSLPEEDSSPFGLDHHRTHLQGSCWLHRVVCACSY